MEGGAVYNNLDWSYANDDITGLGRNPWGERQSGKEVREQLRVLVKTINSFNIIKARPLDSSCPLWEGTYLIKWLDNLNGHVLQEKIIHHKGEKLSLKVPEFSDDLALCIIAVNK